MHAILFADRSGSELVPINQYYCPALLPLQGKPIIQHWLETLQRVGVTVVHIVLGAHSESVRKTLETGFRWSLQINYLHHKQDTSYHQLLQRQGSAIEYPCVALRGDVVDKSWLVPQNSNKTTQNFSQLNSLFLTTFDDTVNQLEWNNIKHALSRIDASKCDIYPLLTLKNYHHLVLNAVEFANDIAIDSRRKSDFGLLTGSHADYSISSLTDGHYFIDDYADVQSFSKLIGRCYIGKRCIIDHASKISNSVILDDTWVANGAVIENAIVVHNHIYRVDLNSHFAVDDISLLGNTQVEKSVPWHQRTIALLMLLVTFPFLVLMFNVKFIHNLVNRNILRETTQKSFARSSYFQITKYLLSLTSVLKGELFLFGRKNDVLLDSAPWHSVYREVPVGWTSLARVMSYIAEISHHQSSAVDYQLYEIENFSSSTRQKLKRCIRQVLYSTVFSGKSRYLSVKRKTHNRIERKSI